jgi:hypothetical protein
MDQNMNVNNHRSSVALDDQNKSQQQQQNVSIDSNQMLNILQGTMNQMQLVGVQLQRVRELMLQQREQERIERENLLHQQQQFQKQQIENMRQF